MQNEELVKWPFLKQTWGIEFEKSVGMYLYTKEGQKILDAAGGAIVSNIGYGREDVAEAVADAVKASKTEYAPTAGGFPINGII